MRSGGDGEDESFDVAHRICTPDGIEVAGAVPRGADLFPLGPPVLAHQRFDLGRFRPNFQTRMRDDAWATLMTSQNAMITMMGDIAEAGLAAVPAGSPARRRLEQMQDFYSYLLDEMPTLIERWHAAR